MNHQTLIPALALCFFTLLCGAQASAQEVVLNAGQPKITTASSVRARSGPQVAAQEVTRLKLGTVVTAVARSAEEYELGGKRDYWYRVELPGGGSGWVFGGLLADYDAARRRDIVRRIIDDRLKIESMSFEDGMDFHSFVSTVLAETNEPAAKGELELFRLHAIDRAFRLLTDARREQPEFYKAHAQEIYYHELAGGWAVRPEVFWELESKYRGSATGDRIAWDAAHALRPGECESDEVCQFLALHDTEGKYLSLYPQGEHVREALENLAQALSSERLKESLDGKGGDEYAVEERTMLRKALTDLRATVSRTTASEKTAILKRLDQLVPATR